MFLVYSALATLLESTMERYQVVLRLLLLLLLPMSMTSFMAP